MGKISLFLLYIYWKDSLPSRLDRMFAWRGGGGERFSLLIRPIIFRHFVKWVTSCDSQHPPRSRRTHDRWWRRSLGQSRLKFRMGTVFQTTSMLETEEENGRRLWHLGNFKSEFEFFNSYNGLGRREPCLASSFSFGSKTKSVFFSQNLSCSIAGFIQSTYLSDVRLCAASDEGK